MRSKSIVLLALALGCGLVASIGISQVMERRNQNSGTPGEVEPIVVALNDINPNDPITDQNVKIEDWPRAKVPNGAVTKLEEYANKRARQKIFAGEPIIQGKIIDVKDMNSASMVIPAGYRTVTVRVDAVSGGGSLILPGDRIDVLVFLSKNPSLGIQDTETRTILQDIKVFAVDTAFQPSPDQGESAIAAKTISLLVTPQQAEKVMLASEMGSIRLSMRNGDDNALANTNGTTASELLGGTDNSSRDAEQSKSKGPDQAGSMVSGAASAAKSLLDLIKQQQGAQSKFAAAPKEDAPWKMKVFKGSTIEEMEIGGDGLPVVLGEAGTTAPPPTQEPGQLPAEAEEPAPVEEPTTTPDAETPTTEDTATTPAPAGPRVSLKE